MVIRTERVFIVMNMFDKRRTTASPERIADITKTEVAAVLPFDDRLATPAMDRGVPFLPENKTHPISKGIFAMIKRIKTKIEEFEKVEAEARELYSKQFLPGGYVRAKSLAWNITGSKIGDLNVFTEKTGTR